MVDGNVQDETGILFVDDHSKHWVEVKTRFGNDGMEEPNT